MVFNDDSEVDWDDYQETKEERALKERKKKGWLMYILRRGQLLH
jgi:hypothetical protein